MVLVYVSGSGSAETQQFTHANDVYMRDYTDDEIRAYIQTRHPMDKAGAYGIQHPDFRPVARYVGCYASVMGLPICNLADPLQQMGIVLPEPIVTDCPNGVCYRQSEFDPLFVG